MAKPQDKFLQQEKQCGASWQRMNDNGATIELKCRHCGVYLTDGGTPKCLKKIEDNGTI